MNDSGNDSASNLSAEDRTEIAELVARYCQALDGQDADAFAALFTEDGVFLRDGVEQARGRAGLVAYVERAKAAGRRTMHWTTNLVIEGAANRATARFYVAAYSVTDGLAAAPYVLGQCEDDLVKVSGRWRYQIRRVKLVAGNSRATPK